jgi:sugar (pentulose or hexulose) kinase
VLNLMGLNGKDHRDVETMLQSTQPGSAGVSFWPFLVSAGVSGLVPGTKGQLSGLQLAHRPADVVRAVIEGLAFELNRYLGFLRAADWPVAQLVMGGGAAGSGVTTQIIADVAGVPLVCLENSETSLLGAAILARGLVEARTSLVELSSDMVPPARPVEPGAETTLYQDKYGQYLRSLPLQQVSLS